ncbi:MAG: glycosyltransferase family 4 protein [Chloroflexi bacterium]|nr:glycosyltransferase family 4 protein [Chloroflexota bacterium]
MEHPSTTPLNIHIIANATIGSEMSGGDRIFIECARRWAAWGHRVHVYVWEEGYALCRKNGLDGVTYHVWRIGPLKELGFALPYFFRTLRGLIGALRVARDAAGPSVVYSASDFWPDSLPGLAMAHHLNAPWIAALYLFAPNPFKGFRGSHREGYRLPAPRTVLYYLSQKPVDGLITRCARAVFVTSEPDRQIYVRRGFNPDSVVAVKGGVDIAEARRTPAAEPNKYAAVFVGRFHPQKGVLELVDIWDRVRQSKANARLAVIGVGALEQQMRQEIERRGLGANVDFLGFKDGEAKYRIVKSSRVFLHPAVYDSGGMAAVEAMACGLPAVGFDLPALKTYYPQGMLKAPIGDTAAFARRVLDLLDDPALYARTSADALCLAEQWDWDRRAAEILEKVKTAL